MIGSDTAGSGGRIIVGSDGDNTSIKNNIIQNTPSGSSGHGVMVYSGATGILIENNTIANTAWEALLIEGDATVSGNVIKDIASNKGIYLLPGSKTLITGNAISNTFYEGILAEGSAIISDNEIVNAYKGIQFRGVDTAVITGNTISDTTYEGIQASANAIISDNEISGAYHGIQLRGDGTSYTVTGNSIHDNQYHGIEVPNYSGEIVAALTVEGNFLTDNPYCGIKVGDADVSDYSVNYNNITGNGIYGVESFTSVDLDATNNWWGDPLGPSGIHGAPGGFGDPVSDNVDWGSPLGAPIPEPASVIVWSLLIGITWAGGAWRHFYRRRRQA